MVFLRLAVWMEDRGFLNGRKRNWGTKGDPERRLGYHCPDMMKGRKKQHVYNAYRGGEQLILTQQERAAIPEGLASGGCAIAASAENGDRQAQHTSFRGWEGSLRWLQGEQGPLRSALCETLACFPAVYFWFCTVHSAQSAQSPVVTLAREPRAVYRSSLGARTQQCKPGSLAIFHTATVTGSQNM